MTINDESTLHNRDVQSYNTYYSTFAQDATPVDQYFPLLNVPPAPANRRKWKGVNSWVPRDAEDTPDHHHRSCRRRLFLLITEPETSLLSAIFYVSLMVAIFLVNAIMVFQTMDAYQFTPDDCVTCGGSVSYIFESDDYVADTTPGIACVCPPEPFPWTQNTLNTLMGFFVFEWCLRVVTYVSEEPSSHFLGRMWQSFEYLTSMPSLIDALAIFPYYLEMFPRAFISLRLLKIFRIFQLLRLGQYNVQFLTLTNVMGRSLNYLRMLLMILTFGAAIFGSMIYWVEKGTWKYHEDSQSYRFMRPASDGFTEEPSPFTSIPQAFWWFMVTATTVGYGDYHPTSTAGKFVACFAMMMGVLVIAFPVSVFSDLWQNELKNIEGFEDLREDEAPNSQGNSKKPVESDAKSQSNVAKESKTTGPSLFPEVPIDYTRDTVVVEKEDIQRIAYCMATIKRNQEQIDTILQKYRIYYDDSI